MSSENHEKIDELLLKLRSLGDRAKSTRAQLGSPLVDRVLERVNRISAKLPVGNGDSRSQQPVQAQEPRVVCPRCGKTYLETIAFCSGCGFSFEEARRKQEREQIEGEKIERTGRMGIIT